ncbi:MAG TPA: hypothetical protein PK218_10445 [Flavobacterium sp.]|jgi:hypothetical protein|nr:hypothetical protein [Bacteroidales bacterium]HPW98970.1 hypothetical protein [Flavobacterium sp.]
MNEKIIKLVEYALADGEISDKELQVLYKKCDENGIKHDELENYISTHLKGKSEVFTPNDSKISDELETAIQRLDAITVSIKTAPKASRFSIQFRIVAILMTFGIYHIISMLSKKSSLGFHGEKVYYDNINEIKTIKEKYGNHELIISQFKVLNKVTLKYKIINYMILSVIVIAFLSLFFS